MNLFYRIARGIIYPFVRFLFNIKVIGLENFPLDRPFILAPNHISLSDPIFLAVICKKQIHFMSKMELFKIPVLKQIITWAGAFAVDRGKGDVGALNHARSLIAKKKVLGIFPEGKRYKTGAPRMAKSGVAHIALDMKADILPVSLYREGKFCIFKKTTIRFGKILTYNELVDENATHRANLKNITHTLTEKITELWEMKH